MKQFFKEFWQTKSGKLCVGFLIPALFLLGDLILYASSMELGAIGVAIADMCLFLLTLFCFFIAIPPWARFWTNISLLIGVPAFLELIVLGCFLCGALDGKSAFEASGIILNYVALPIWGIWLITWIIRCILKHQKLRSFFEIFCILLLPFYLDNGGVGVVFLWVIAYALVQEPLRLKILYLEAVLSILYMGYFSIIGIDCRCINVASCLQDRCNLGCRNKDLWIWEIIVWSILLFTILWNTVLKKYKTTHLGLLGRTMLMALYVLISLGIFGAFCFVLKIIMTTV